MLPSGWRRRLARSDSPIARAAKALAKVPESFSVPAPRAVSVPMLWGYLAAREATHFARRVLFAEPINKAYFTSYGRGVHTGIWVHWVTGRGEFVVGDDVWLDGKSSIKFANRFVERPRFSVGDRSAIGHGCEITVGKEVSIGSDCRIASGVIITDSSGHPSDASSRLSGAPPSDEDVRPVKIGNNVWIGKRAIVLPGVTIGEGSIISSGAVVMSDVPAYTLAAGNPARRVGQVSRAEPPKSDAELASRG